MGKADETGATEAVEVESRALAPVGAQAVMELSADDIVQRLEKIQDVQRRAMKPKIDYGVIPGTGSKPTLLKAGAEKLCVLFRLDAQFETQTVFSEQHMTAITKCTIYHQMTQQRLGGATALCSSRESKYAYRKGSRKCPSCGKETLIHTKRNPEDWWCNKYKDGCGANFDKAESAVVNQQVGRVENENVADQFPTVMRMAEKRALIATVRLVTGASAIFDEPMADAEPDDSPDPSDSFHASTDNPPSDALQAAAADYGQAFKDEVAAREDGGVKATRIALIKKAKDKLGDVTGIQWLSTATKEIGKTSETLTIDDMLGLSERLTKLKAAEAPNGSL
jgi:hypothetical protein